LPFWASFISTSILRRVKELKEVTTLQRFEERKKERKKEREKRQRRRRRRECKSGSLWKTKTDPESERSERS